jgi:PhnB protein
MNDHSLLSPYLNFNGNCAEAMQFYQSIFGGKLDMQRFGDTPEMPVPEAQKDKVIHATLTNDVLSFMASDGRPDQPVIFGDSVHMSLAGKDEVMLTKYFNGLAEGGKIDMPLAKQFWGDIFGMVTDKFGIHWMVNISSGEHTQ